MNSIPYSEKEPLFVTFLQRSSSNASTASLEESTRSSETSAADSVNDQSSDTDLNCSNPHCKSHGYDAQGSMVRTNNGHHHAHTKTLIEINDKANKIQSTPACWSRRSKILLGLFLGIPVLFCLCVFYQGCSLLLEYRAFFGSKAPITISRAHGVVAAAVSTNASFVAPANDSQSQEKLNIQQKIHPDLDYHFKTYRPSSALENSLAQTPIRLFVVGDSIARGVGHSKSCYPTMPETIAAIVSQHHNGRPVFWTAVGEPGATMKWIAKQVLEGAKDHGNGDAPVSMQQFHDFNADNSGWEASSGGEDGLDNHYSRVQMQWIQKLQYHQRLHDANSFAGYDYVIALSGVNDIKRTLVPFLVQDEKVSSLLNNEDGHGNDRISKERGFHGDLKRFIRDLKRVSNFHDRVCTHAPQEDNGTSSQCTQRIHYKNEKLPYVIFPSFPTKHVPAKVGAILRWTAVASTGILDGIKKRIADENPHHIFAAPPPSDDDTLAFEAKDGPLWNALREEDVMLRLFHANGKVCQDLVNEMDTFYSRHKASQESGMLAPAFFSNDAMHPNDLGYDLFGRHLGRSVIRRWKSEDNR